MSEAEQRAETDAPSDGADDRQVAANVMSIPVTVQVVLGSAVMPVSRITKLGRGGVIPLDRRVGEPVDVVVNGHVVARGEIVGTQNDSRFGVSLTEIVGRPGLEDAD